MDGSSVQKRRRGLKACMRCHSRKQRCVGYPACQNCQAAKLSCVRDSALVSHRFAGLSKQKLIQKLESVMSSSSREKSDDSFVQSASASTYSGQRHHSDSRQALDCQPEVSFRDSDNATGQHASPSDVIETHPAHQTPEDAVWNDEETLSGTAQEEFNPMKIDGDQVKRAAPPDDVLGAQLLTTYLENMHRRSPFLEFSEILRVHERRHGDLFSDPRSRHGGFKLYMVYAIGATILRLTRPYTSTRPENYFATALYFKSAWRGDDQVRDIEAILLIINYKLRTSLESRIWYLIGLGMRTAVNAGMHREYYYRGLDSRTASARRRIFWATYTLERNIASSLKRPFSIADHDIDTREGTESDYDYNMPDGITCPQVHDRFSDNNSSATTTVAADAPRSHRIACVAVFRLTRIRSRAYVEINRVDKPLSESRKEVQPLLNQLRQFEATLSEIAERDYEWVLLHYNDSVRKIIEPFLKIIQPYDKLMRVCLQASGRMCQLFKGMRLRKLSAYSFLMINSFFIAGMTICYALFKSPLLWTPAIANDLRACSTTLFLMAETNPNLRKYRDLLENIINNTMEHVEQASSLEPASVCPCANCSPHTAHSNNVEEAPSAFSQLYGTFTRLNFEFPSRSYPEYTVDSSAQADHAMPPTADAAATGRLPSGGGHEPKASAQWPDAQHSQTNFMPRSAISFARVPGHCQDIDSFLVPDLWDFSSLEEVPTGLSDANELMQ